MIYPGLPSKRGLYDPNFEHDACGIGFVANIKGVKSHQCLEEALKVLVNLAHRGGVGSEKNTGDGAGILFQIPHNFFQKACSEAGFFLPPAGTYGVAMVFYSAAESKWDLLEEQIQSIVEAEGQIVLGWRCVPFCDSILGKTAKTLMPAIRQLFIGKSSYLNDNLAFERKLYIIRKRIEREVRGSSPDNYIYITSLSSKTIVYKGMLMPKQLRSFYPDLSDPSINTALALVHSRYSTNTFPSWERSHPYRYLVHNGEINTLRGNINWMHARQSLFASSLFGEDLKKVMPIIDFNGSDSAMFDECLELLHLAGRSLPHAVMMMIPEPWSKHESMCQNRKDFYMYHSCLMEPWDGPAAMAFTDGTRVGAVLDRNGLRPSRYYITKDDMVVLASEAGVLDIPPEKVRKKGRLSPGKMMLIDTIEGRVISDAELKKNIQSEHPYGAWLRDNLKSLDDLDVRLPLARKEKEEDLTERQKAFGYTHEELRRVLLPMAMNGEEAVGSMGDDTPLAVLSDKPQLLFNYFKQLFAQVTNPPIDAIREDIVIGTEVLLGAEGNLLEPTPESCRRIMLKTPVLDNLELEKLRLVKERGFKAVTLPLVYAVKGKGKALEEALAALCRTAEKQVAAGANIIVLSDREVDGEKAPIPSLLAVSGLHHYLIRRGNRAKVSLVVETGEAREVHHIALLIGYGAAAVNPYLALDTVKDLVSRGLLTGLSREEAAKNYLKAIVKGLVKVLSKMGISTVQSYQGAQIFEAVGISPAVIDQYFTWTPSRIGGIGLEIIARETEMRHGKAFGEGQNLEGLAAGGLYQWRKNEEHHLYNPETIYLLQQACRKGDYQLFKRYSALLQEQHQGQNTLRGLLKFKVLPDPIPLEEVEPEEAILRRFKTGAMSYGSISREAHECLAIAMNRIKGKSNTGEGGEDPGRFLADASGDSRCSAIKQVASGRFGVSSHYLVSAREIQIKMAQGAKPGEGGQLPANKVYPWIAETRLSTPGVGLISPPPHHDIYSIEDLAQLIYDLKAANPRARISVKLVSEAGVGTIAAGVAKGKAHVVLISGFDGGTGAAPRTSIRHAGLPWELGLAETHQTLVMNNLRRRIIIETDGKLMTGRDVAVAALLGAEEYGFATAPLVALGCVMMRVCNLDTCPVGIASQKPSLRSRFSGKPEYVVNFMTFIARELREIMAALGFKSLDVMVGRTDKLEQCSSKHWKKQHIDLSALLSCREEAGRPKDEAVEAGPGGGLDSLNLMERCCPALEQGKKVYLELPIKNTDRAAGTNVGSEVTRLFGGKGLPPGTIELKFTGSAGQSFGAFIPRGIALALEGDANDYFGKGLSGGRIVVYPPRQADFVPENNIIIGNVSLYGATGGEAYVCGIAGERFCVRNSGADAVVEGLGDHGCEYMTGGRVVVLGPTGRNFAAGMSGGIAYVLDLTGDFTRRLNKEMVCLEKLLESEEAKEVYGLIEKHLKYTGSRLAGNILDRWEQMRGKFVKVIPKDYKRMLKAIREAEEQGLSGEAVMLAAFEKSKGERIELKEANERERGMKNGEADRFPRI